MYILITCLILFFLIVKASAQILLFTFAYNLTDFIEIQYKTFRKFLKDDYELIVINDADNPEMVDQILDICNKYDLRCINIPTRNS